jgi:integrase
LTPGFRAGELCALRRDNVLWQQKGIRLKAKGGPYGKKTKVRAVFHGRRGEVRQLYWEREADQLDAPGLVANILVLNS